jgi:PAS domain S-box-containing protein
LNTVNVPDQFRPLFEKAQEYVSEYFGLKKEDPSKGTIEIFGERYILVRAASMSVEFFDTIMNLYSSEGEDEAINIARSILFDIAHTVGKMDARNFHKKMNLNDPIEKLSAGPIHFSHSGWAFVDIFPESTPSPDENYCLVYDHPFSFESDAWVRAGRTTKFPVCVMNAGYSSGWCEESFGVSLVASEIMCKAKGDEACRFVMAHASKIEQYIQDYLKNTPEIARRVTTYQIPGLFERKWMEEKLRESEANYQTIFNEVNDAIFVHDLDTGNILDVNERMCEMFGYTRTEALTLNVGAISSCEPSYTQQDAFEWIKRASEQGPQVFEWQAKHKSGCVFWIEVSLKLAKIMGKERVLAVVRDITERKQAEQTIQEWKNRYETAVLASGHLVYDWDSDTNQITYGGDLEKMLGYTAAEMEGGLKRWTEMIHPEDQSYFKETFEHLIATKEPAHLEFRVRRKDGTYIFVEDSGHFIADTQGKITRMIGFVKNVTERKRAEDALEHLNKELESANLELTRTNRELQEFAYIAAHDLKTPLRGIGILADWISTDYADKFDDRGKERVKLLNTKAKQMSALIDDILQYSTLGRGEAEKQQIDLNVVISEVVAGIDLPNHIEIAIENELPVLTCEKTQIIQAFQNLMGNAVKYMDKAEGQIRVGCIEEGGFWKFSVADNGPGIRKKYFNKIFQMFQTLSPRDGVKSTGIGLSVVKKISEMNGGTAWVESEIGEGSTFFFTFAKKRCAANTACKSHVDSR